MLVNLDAAKLERDEAINDAKAMLLPKWDLEHILAEIIEDVTSLQMMQFEAVISFCQLSKQGERDRGEAAKALGKVSELSTELKVAKAEVTLLHE
ncbi:hypothetical protein ACLOJK_005149 [Asimina triloba]